MEPMKEFVKKISFEILLIYIFSRRNCFLHTKFYLHKRKTMSFCIKIFQFFINRKWNHLIFVNFLKLNYTLLEISLTISSFCHPNAVNNYMKKYEVSVPSIIIKVFPVSVLFCTRLSVWFYYLAENIKLPFIMKKMKEKLDVN